MSEAASFEEDLQFGLEWEEEVSKRLESILLSMDVSNISFEDKPDMQLAGIDSILEKDEVKIDVKTERDKHRNSPNLPIEVWSMFERNKPGWFYTSESDLIVWTRANKAQNNLHSTGYFMVLDDELREWFNERHEEYRRVEIENEDWTTVIRLVPIDDFPPNHLVEFNPTLEKNKQTDQLELKEWS